MPLRRSYFTKRTPSNIILFAYIRICDLHNEEKGAWIIYIILRLSLDGRPPTLLNCIDFYLEVRLRFL